MIDMDYERAYKAVLQTATQWIKDGCTDKEKICLECVFPELRESEDERIRKELIGMVKFHCADEHLDRYLNWLEKQKENHKSADSIPSDCVSDAKCEDKSPKHSDSDGTDIRDTPAYWKGWDDAMKQKEQKHPNGCFTCDEYKKGYEAGRLNGFTAGYNKAMKEIDQKEQKPEERFEEAREKYQVEWSEEDEAAYDAFICEVVNEKMNPTVEQIKWLRGIRDRLKSLCPSWKPSEEQMTNLLRTEGRLRIKGESVLASKLAELYEQLKKLINK